MYVWSVDDAANLMPLFCFMLMQGDQLLSASIDGDMASVRRLLEEEPNNLVRYKDLVRRTEQHSTYACMYVRMLFTIVLALLHHLLACICPSIYYYCHTLITCTQTYIHCIFPAQLLRHVITEPCILS